METSTGPILFVNITEGQTFPQTSLGFLQTAQAVLLRRSLYYIVNPTILSASVVANSINVAMFITMGLSDGMSCLFLALSVSDLLNCSLMLGERISGALQVFGKQEPYVNLLALSFIFSRNANTWHIVSTLLTVFAAINKCACVTFPLTFRFFFTRRRSIFVIVAIKASVVISYSPLFYIDRLGPYFDGRLNRTRIGYQTRSRKLYRETADYYLFAHFTCLQFTALCVTIMCVVVMTFKLKEAARMRQNMKAGRSKESDLGTKKKQCGSSGAAEEKVGVPMEAKGPDNRSEVQEKELLSETGDGAGGGSSAKDQVFSSRELRVLSSVNLTCAIFIGGTAPYVMLTAFALFLPSFDHRGQDRTLYHIVKSSQDIWYYGSTAINIFVYYKYNSKYKHAFNSIFGCFQGGQQAPN